MRIVRLLLVAVFLVSLTVTGCGGGDNSGSDNDSSTSDSDSSDDGSDDSTSSSYSWGTAEQINAQEFMDDSQFAIAANGHAIVAYEPYGGDDADTIWANYYDGTNWGTAQQIDSGTGRAWDPQVAIDINGHVIVIWEQYDGSDYCIWANYHDGTNWSTAEKIYTGTGYAGDAGDADIAVDGEGHAIVAWQQRENADSSIWVKYYDGTNWGAAGQIGTSTDNMSDSQIAVGTNGHAIVAWEQYEYSTRSYSIWANYYDGTNWGTAQRIDTGYIELYEEPKIAVDDNGHAILVWEQRTENNSNNSIWANYHDGTNWGAAEQIDPDSGDAKDPTLAFFANGNVIVVWERSYLWANYYDGTNWGTAERIDTGSTLSANGLDIGVDAAGHAILVWRHYSTNSSVWANYYDGTNWSAAERIDTGTYDAWDPQVAVDAAGHAIAIWTQYENDTYSIWANSFQ